MNGHMHDRTMALVDRIQTINKRLNHLEEETSTLRKQARAGGFWSGFLVGVVVCIVLATAENM